MITEEIRFFGHKNILSTHPRTLEITKEENLTLNGDCIIGVRANKACYDIRVDLKEKLKSKNIYIEFELIVEPYSVSFSGKGNSGLLLTDKHDIVLRKSKFVCGRTICINSSIAAIDIPRQIVDLLKDPNKEAFIRIKVD